MRRFLLLSAAVCCLPLLACSGSHASGEACADDRSCDSDEASCRLDFPGTFCAQSCITQGEAAGCPENTLCGPQLGDLLMCSPTCESQDDCREGYQCNGLSGSSVKTCQVRLE